MTHINDWVHDISVSQFRSLLSPSYSCLRQFPPSPHRFASLLSSGVPQDVGEGRGARPLDGRACVAVGVVLLAYVSRRWFSERRLGIRFSSGGVASVSSESGARRSELWVFLFGDVAGGFVMGGPRAGFLNLSGAWRFVFFSFSMIGMEIRSFPLVGFVSNTPPVSSACLDYGSGVSASDLEAATSISYPPSSVARRRPAIVQRFKLWPGVSPVLPSLAAFLMFGCFCCREGWIQLRSVGGRVERLVEEDDLDMFVIYTFLRALRVKGGGFGCNVLI
jgi:hypothetical protein